MRDGVIICGITAVLYAPWLISSLHHQIQMVQQDFWVQRPTWASVADVVSSLAGVEWWSIWRHLLAGWVPTIVVAVLATAAAVLLIQWRQPANHLGTAMLLHALLPPLGIAVCSCFGRPLLMDKVFLPSAAMLPVVFAVIAKNRWGRGVALLMLVLAIGGTWGFLRDCYKEDWRGVVAAIQAAPPQRRLIVFVANDGQLPFDYYDPDKSLGERTGVPAGFFDVNPPRTMLRVLKESDLDGLEGKLAADDYPEVILVYAHTGWSDPQQLTKAFLQSRYAVAEDRNGADIEVIRYKR